MNLFFGVMDKELLNDGFVKSTRSTDRTQNVPDTINTADPCHLQGFCTILVQPGPPVQ